MTDLIRGRKYTAQDFLLCQQKRKYQRQMGSIKGYRNQLSNSQWLKMVQLECEKRIMTTIDHKSNI